MQEETLFLTFLPDCETSFCECIHLILDKFNGGHSLVSMNHHTGQGLHLNSGVVLYNSEA